MKVFDELTNKNFELFAATNYDNPECMDVLEFKEDLSRFKYLKRLLKRYETDGDLQERKSESAWWMSAYCHSNPSFHRAVLGATGERRIATSAVCVVDPRSLYTRPLLRAADSDGRLNVWPTVVESNASRSNAAKNYDGAPSGVHRLLSMVSSWPSALLAGQ